MITQVLLATVFAGITFIMFSKKSIGNILREVKYEYRFQDIGFWSVIDDIRMKNKNKLKEKPDKKGQVAVVTGGARGIGFYVVKTLVECGMTVIIGVRKVEAGNKVAEEIKNMNYPGQVVVHQLDVASLSSVREFAKLISKQYLKIDLLVNNAGIMFGDYKVTADGFESQLATNYLGHFLLTHLLLPNIKAAGMLTENNARIVNVSSCAHKASGIFFDDINLKTEYITSAAYSQSKLAQIMSARHIDRILREEGSKVKCYSVHPGVVNTDLFENTSLKKHSQWVMDLLFKKPEEGSISILYTCFSPEIEEHGGAYISNCRIASDSVYSRKQDMQEKLFDVTCKMLHIKKFGEV